MASINESAKQSAKGKNPSVNQQPSSSADTVVESISIADGLTKFYESRCEFYESAFVLVDQQAAKDVMGKFLKYDKQNREQIGGDFFGNLETKRQALRFGLSPSLFLPEAVDPLIAEMCDRNDFLLQAEKTRELTVHEIDELSALQVKLRELGELE